MKKQLKARKLRLSKETISDLTLVQGTGILSRIYDCEWEGVSRGFSNCDYCSDSCWSAGSLPGNICV